MSAEKTNSRYILNVLFKSIYFALFGNFSMAAQQDDLFSGRRNEVRQPSEIINNVAQHLRNMITEHKLHFNLAQETLHSTCVARENHF